MGGDVHIDEVERAIGHELPPGDYETIAGFVIAHHGALPELGSIVEVELPLRPSDLVGAEDVAPPLLRVEVLAIERHVPALVRVTTPVDDQAEEALR